MKKIILSFCIIIALVVSGCFETAKETTINEDGSGIVVTNIDMSAILKLSKMMGGDEVKEMEKLSIDTLINLSDLKDSISNLSDAEKKLLQHGTMRAVMNPTDEKIVMSYSFPYSALSEMMLINGVMKKILSKTQSQIMGKMMPGDDEGKNIMGDDKGMPDLDDYFTFSFEKGKISKKINKEKYTEAATDKTLTSIREVGAMGMPMTIKTIYNLPKAATKAEGKGINLSADKRKVTIETTLDDFFDNPGLFEYEIEF